MKVFISFSGGRSRLVAEALHKWLRQAVHAARPFLSEYIGKGSQWPTELTSALNACNFGIVCLTPENITEPWILFEAGALSKAVGERTHVCPYLLGLDKSDVPPPLGLFQLTMADKEDTLRLVRDLNAAIPAEQRLSEGDIGDVFEQWWPKLEGKLKEIGASVAQAERKRGDRELLEEMLGLLRSQEQRESSRQALSTQALYNLVFALRNALAHGSTGMRAIDYPLGSFTGSDLWESINVLGRGGSVPPTPQSERGDTNDDSKDVEGRAIDQAQRKK